MFPTPKNTAFSTYTFGSIKASVSKGEYRYGFNGMEKDHELKGEGNSLDFGARIYDSRLGRWLSVDPLAHKFPSDATFIFAGNSPISLIDKGGQFKFNPQLQKNNKENYSPILEKYLAENLKNDVINSPILMASLIKHGKFTEAQIKEGLTWGKGPEIIIDEIAFDAGGFYNYSSTDKPNEFFSINVNLVKLLESSSDEDKQAALLAVVSTILHEYVHYGDDLNSPNSDKRGQGKKENVKGIITDEQGQKFEIDAYGLDIGEGHNMEGVTNWSKYLDDSKKAIEIKPELAPTVPKT